MHIFRVCILYTEYENSIEKHPLYSKCQFERVLTWLSTILRPARVFLSIRYEVDRNLLMRNVHAVCVRIT